MDCSRHGQGWVKLRLLSMVGGDVSQTAKLRGF